MKIWPIAVQNAMRQTEDAAGGCGIGDEDGPAFTLRADGGRPPSVAVVHDNGAKVLEIATEVSPTLTCQQDKHPWAVFPLDLRNALRDADREGRTGVGFGNAGEPANTVTQGAVPAVAFAQNQRNEIRQMDVVGALAAEPGMKQTAYIAQERERERERKWTIRSTSCEELRPWKRSVCRHFRTDIRTSSTTASQRRTRCGIKCLATQ